MSEQPPNEQTETQTTGHVYDGIEEYDNPTPAWMTWVFLVFLIFMPIYMAITLMSGGAISPQGQYERAYVANLEKKFGELGTLEPDAATILKYSTDPQWLAFGQTVYQANCTTCHGANAGGITGPNLTDDHYINITSIGDFGDVLANGRAAGNMPAFANRLHPNELVLVSSYVASLKGTNAPGGKGPEGNLISGDWSAGDAPAPDATDTPKPAVQ